MTAMSGQAPSRLAPSASGHLGHTKKYGGRHVGGKDRFPGGTGVDTVVSESAHTCAILVCSLKTENIMRKRQRQIILTIVLTIVSYKAHAQADIICQPGNGLCVFPHPLRPGQTSTVDFACDDGTSLQEEKFVCLSGVNRGQSFDIFCRAGGTPSSESVRNHDFKCNIKETDACPNSGQLTQFTDKDHCDHKASGNWTRPANYKLPPGLGLK
jgi:hypothetical protein